MHIYGPNSSYHIDPVGDHPDDGDQEQRRRSKSVYKGRKWGPKPEDSINIKPSHDDQSSGKRDVVFDKACLDQARKWLKAMTTVEEKIAQLCLYVTEAVYDAPAQHETERLIMGWQIGGVVFKAGDFRRQSYLIDRFQEVSKTPLIIGNDFKHGLSFYYRDEPYSLPNDEERLADLGKAVMGLNRSLQVHFQFDQDGSLSEELSRAFRRGIRQAKGLVARTIPERHLLSASSKQLPLATTTLPEIQQSLYHTPQEVSGIKTLTVYDLIDGEVTEQKLLEALKGEYDCFICSDLTIKKAMTLLATAHIKGRLREADLDRYVIKLLYLKARLYTQTT